MIETIGAHEPKPSFVELKQRDLSENSDSELYFVKNNKTARFEALYAVSVCYFRIDY